MLRAKFHTTCAMRPMRGFARRGARIFSLNRHYKPYPLNSINDIKYKTCNKKATLVHLGTAALDFAVKAHGQPAPGNAPWKALVFWSLILIISKPATCYSLA